MTRAQHEIAQDLPHAALPSFERIGQALEHGMPPISRAAFEPDDVVQMTIDHILSRLAEAHVPAETAAAIQAVRVASPDVRRGMIAAALEDEVPTDGPTAGSRNGCSSLPACRSISRGWRRCWSPTI